MNISVDLYDHQLSAIHLLEQHEITNEYRLNENTLIERNIGIFCDPPGYGKTLSILGMIARNRMQWNTDTPYIFRSLEAYYSHGILSQYNTRVLDKIDTTLILVSPSILNQWKKELNRTKLSYYVVKTKQNIANLDATQYNIVLCIHSMYNHIINKYNNTCWKRFVFDDPIALPSMNSIVAGFYWFITDDPKSLITTQNKRTENFYNSIFSLYIERQVWNHIIIKNTKAALESSYTMQPIISMHWECYQPEYNIFNSEYARDMISSGNIAGVVLLAGGNYTNNITELLQENCDNSELEMLLTRYNKMIDDNCVVCMCSIREPVMLSECQHIFCGECIMTWLKGNNFCPMCRTLIRPENLIYINTSNTSIEYPRIPPTKCEKLVDIITENRKGKFIIFSAFLDTINNIRNILTDSCIEFIEIKGRASTRERQIETFRNGDVNVLFLNSREKYTGIDLEFVSDIIIYHDMSNNIKSQIISRAVRIGRTIPLTMHFLI